MKRKFGDINTLLLEDIQFKCVKKATVSTGVSLRAHDTRQMN